MPPHPARPRIRASPTGRRVARPARVRPERGALHPGLLASGPFRLGLLGVLGVGVGLALLDAIDSVSSVLVYAGLAYFLALVLEPLVALAGRRGVPRGAAVAVLAVLLVGALVGVVAIVGPAVAAQAVALTSTVPDALQWVLDQPWFSVLASQLGIGRTLNDLVETIGQYLADPARLSGIAGGLLSVGSGIVTGVEGVVLVVVLTIYFALALPSLTTWLFRLVPATRRKGARSVYDEMASVVGGYVRSQLLIASLNAVFTLTLLLIVGVPSALLLALLAFVAALIPVVGTLAAGAAITVIAFFTSPVAGVVMLIYYVTYHPFEGYVLGPRLTSRAVSVPGYAVLIAVVAGSTLGGILGALVAVPVTAAGSILIERVVVPRQARR